MEYTAELTVHTDEPLTDDTLAAAAAIGGAASGSPGTHALSATLTVDADSMPEAAARALELITGVAPGQPVAVEVMTVDEHDRRLAQPPFPALVGVAEVAADLGVSRQRVSTLSHREDFPAPVARLASGPVWRAGDLSTFALGWQRKPGRPSKAS